MQAIQLGDIRRVLTVPKPAAFTRATKATAGAWHAAFRSAKEGFCSRPNPITWARLVTASRRLHKLKRQNDKPPGGGTPTKPSTPPKRPRDSFYTDDDRKQAHRWLDR